MSRTCDACGKPTPPSVGMGGALLCPICAETVRLEIDGRRAAGEPVNALGIARAMYREEHRAGNYLLRDVPKDLMDAAKHRAIDDNTTVREVIIAALRAYL